MKFKNILLSTVAFGGLMLGGFTSLTVDASQTKRVNGQEVVSCEQVEHQNNKLQSNQTELFYMYSNNEGHFLLDSLADYENVIYVELNDWKIDSNFKIDVENLHHGKKFIGTFTDDSLWELEGLTEVFSE